MTTELRRPLFPTFIWGFILFCFFGLLAIVAVRYYGTFENYEDQRAQVRLANIKEYREEMTAKLGTLAWADKEAQTVQVPIDVAMEIAIAKLNRKKIAPSTVAIVPPVPVDEAATKPTETEAASSPEGGESPTTTQE